MPDPTAPPPTSTAAAGSELDRLQSEVGILLQEAKQTQASIQRLQSSASTAQSVDLLPSVFEDLGSDLPLSAAGAGLALALAAVTWWLWRRNPVSGKPLTLAQQHRERAKSESATALVTQAGALPHELPAARAVETATSFDSGFMDSAFYIPETTGETTAASADHLGGFDSEAAASEVIRVRKSLAEKRRARAISLQQEEIARSLAARQRDEQVLQEQLDHLDVDLDLIAQAPWPDARDTAPAPVPALEQAELFQTLAEANIEPIPDANGESKVSGPAEPADAHDDAVKLELAQEALLLDLLPQARELALEVLEAGDPRLVPEAQALADRIDQMEQDSRQAQLQWRDEA